MYVIVASCVQMFYRNGFLITVLYFDETKIQKSEWGKLTEMLEQFLMDWYTRRFKITVILMDIFCLIGGNSI